MVSGASLAPGRDDSVLMASCNENNGDFFSLGLAPVPEAAAPDF
jgi:hypothetical protein